MSSPLLPAARRTDHTSHARGSNIAAPCASNTEIETLAAARVADSNDCRRLSHVTNRILWGSEYVLIEGKWASRETDQSVCGGVISSAAQDVEIGGPTLMFKMRTRNPPGSTHGNTMVAISEESKTIYMVSFLEYSGPNASTEYAAKAQSNIEGTWGGRTTTINGQQYSVEVQVNVRVRAEPANPTPGYDQIRVDDTTPRSNQTLFGDGLGNQTSKDADPNTWVAAHEYGHSLGLQDEYHDTPTGSVPNDPTKINNIMSQTWPDSNRNPPHPYDDQYQSILNNYGQP
jgi:uncharacterized Zn-binding protein involved in type VI secretion